MTYCALLAMPSDNRGLASADEETRDRVAKAGGEARAQEKGGCQKQGARANRQFLKAKSLCRRLARKANKSKIRHRATETSF
jgi:TfoX/Sxy family transcriptional regulator of competence genes